ncbi:hypothetical protein [Microbulbifer sp. PSTR4-B]|uniref:hypothetical protein n=1 Tax=Microbulbifer sp. PSTR4-B TaxID=3243396 RepID=UPI00403988FC
MQLLINIEFFLLWYRFDNQNSFVLCFSDEADGVFVDSVGQAPTLSSAELTVKYAGGLGISAVNKRPTPHNLDKVINCLEDPNQYAIDCDKTLSIWNLFDDIYRPLGKGLSSKKPIVNKVYEKPFYGDNLPTVIPKGSHCESIWSVEEITLTTRVMNSGMKKLRKSLCTYKQ